MKPSDLDPERWRRIDQVFDLALRASPDDRPDLLDRVCAGDTSLRAEVEALLEAHAKADENFEDLVSPLAAAILASSDDAETAAGRRIGPFRIVREIGRGGMGVVYLAEDTRLGRQVALKALPPYLGTGREARRRFVTEARAVSALDHPNVATLHEIDATDDGQLYMVFAFYEGDTLDERIARGVLPPREAVEIAKDLAAGLAAAHERGIIHRDVKPSNVLLTRDGPVKLLDFGVAKVAGEELTGAPSPIGTVAYMSPEQAGGEPLDGRSDLWSLGVVVYEMITGARPFEGADPASTLHSILHDPPVPPRSLRDEVPESVERVIGRLLCKSPEDRYPSATALLDDLEAVLTGDGTGERASTPLRRGPWAPTRTDVPATSDGRGSRASFLLSTAAILAGVVWMGLEMTAPRAEFQRLAVLPLENLTGDSTQLPLISGIHDRLVTEIGETGAVEVIARASVPGFGASGTSVAEIGRELDVDAVVQGSVSRDGDSLTVAARLTAMSPERLLWEATYRGGLGGVGQIATEVAGSIAAEMGTPTSPTDMVGATTDPASDRMVDATSVDPQAYEAYVRGLFNMDRRNQEGLALADRYLQQAIQIDSGFAPAYANLAEVRGSAAFFGLRDPVETLPGVKALVEKALVIDSTLAIAHARLASVLLYWDRDVEASERAARRALRLNPSLAEAHRVLSEILSVRGRYEEALAEVERGSELDRWSQFSAFRPVVVLDYMRDFARATERAREGIEFFPDFWQGHWLLCLSLTGAGRHEEAVVECQKAAALSNRTPAVMGTLGYVQARMGDPDEARRIVHELEERSAAAYVAPTNVAMIHAALGDRDEAFHWLDRAYREGDLTLVHLRDNARFDMLRDDPRFDALVERMGLDG